MKTKITKILIACSLLLSVSLFAHNDANAQYINNMDFWDHQTPSVGTGDLLGIFIYDSGCFWEIWDPMRFSASATITYYLSNGKTETKNVPCKLFSSGVELVVPAKPANSNSYPRLNVNVHDNKGNSGYYFSDTFIQL